MTFSAAITGLVLLQLKHLLADYFLQSSYIFLNKGRYGHPGGLIHAGIHVVLTLLVLVFLGVGTVVMAGIIIAEFIVHYHIDWTKEKITRKASLDPSKARFWNLHGTDQALHHLTYVAIIWWLAN